MRKCESNKCRRKDGDECLIEKSKDNQTKISYSSRSAVIEWIMVAAGKVDGRSHI